MSKHTKGPWKAGSNGGWGLGLINAVFTVEGDLIACLHTVPVSPRVAANARLIAAAPDLLKALKEIIKCEKRRAASLRHREAYKLVAFSEARMAAAEAAIKKAEE